ncbi:unnamed protein product, partial [Effrenium voratum]
ARLRRVPWSGSTKEKQLDIATGPRCWRVSLEIRSVKLTTAAANIFVSYSYGPVFAKNQPATFRTSPPVMARKGSTTHLPKGFAAYSLAATSAALRAAFEEPLHLELWARDSLRKDTLLGLAEVMLGSAFERPLQKSARLPSMVHGFKVLDQVCLLGSAEETSKEIIGEVRVLLFLEDLGPSSRPLPDQTLHAAVQDGPTARTPGTQRMPRSSPELSGSELQELALEGLQVLRKSPAYAVAYALEAWRHSEEERARARLLERERELRERLEEDYRQRELQRAQSFRQRQQDLRELEQKAKKKLLEMQQREERDSPRLRGEVAVAFNGKCVFLGDM